MYTLYTGKWYIYNYLLIICVIIVLVLLICLVFALGTLETPLRIKKNPLQYLCVNI